MDVMYIEGCLDWELIDLSIYVNFPHPIGLHLCICYIWQYIDPDSFIVIFCLFAFTYWFQSEQHTTYMHFTGCLSSIPVRIFLMAI